VRRWRGLVEVRAPGTPSVVARPAVLVALFYTSVVLALLAAHAWDPRFFATVGPEWERHDPGLLKQADGHIFFDYATDPLRATSRYPRYRTARVLYPLAAHALALGRADGIGWSLLLVNLAAIVLGTELMHRLLERRGLSPWLALVYGAWGGLGSALLHGTSEAFAYLCVLAGIEAQEKGHPVLAGTGFLGGALSRETTLLLAVPYLLLSRRDRRGLSLVALGVFAAWGAWLGIVALVGTGYMIHPTLQPHFPLAGFLATRRLELPVTLVYILAPAVLVLGWAVRELWRRPADASLWAVSLNALLVLQLPPLTAEMFWHSGRLTTGFVAATLLAAPLAASAPRLWRALAILLATSVSWTIAVALRYLFWTVTPW
jgi:hypothetical protein